MPVKKEGNMLRIGDRVCWRNAWGSQPPVTAVVEGIEINCGGRRKYGDLVEEVSWEEVKKGGVVVSLTNGHWAYGYQITEEKGVNL